MKMFSKDEYLATFSGKNIKLDEKTYKLDNIWEYVKNVPNKDYAGYDIYWGYVPFVYQTGDKKYDHVFVSTKTSNAFLLILIDNNKSKIVGHYLLDLNIEYGIEKK